MPGTSGSFDDGGDRVVIELINFPVRLYVEARQHHDELLREFALLALSPPQDRPGHDVPPNLLELVNGLGVRYAEIGEHTDTVGDDLAHRGELSADLRYEVPRGIGPVMQEIAGLFNQAEELCRDGALLTMPTSSLQLQFGTWFIMEFINQTAGQPPSPWTGPLEPAA
jgi:hypothetical protein